MADTQPCWDSHTLRSPHASAGYTLSPQLGQGSPQPSATRETPQTGLTLPGLASAGSSAFEQRLPKKEEPEAARQARSPRGGVLCCACGLGLSPPASGRSSRTAFSLEAVQGGKPRGLKHSAGSEEGAGLWFSEGVRWHFGPSAREAVHTSCCRTVPGFPGPPRRACGLSPHTPPELR